MHEACAVIPVYKETLSASEQKSFDQCLRVLGNHPVVLVCPDTLDLGNYQKENLKVLRFDPAWFISTTTYSRLMLSSGFYEKFSDYRYMLVYQLDAYVFSDQLISWCAKGYDYIGAPWIGDTESKTLVGNGGFSLRNVGTFLAICRMFPTEISRWPNNEDGFWSFVAQQHWPWFRIPDVEIALKFAWETFPEKCFTLNGNILPFGCHAWEGYLDFWGDKII